MASKEMHPSEIPHLLEWYGCYCSCVAETCQNLSASKLLRLLAVDLIIEADKYRRCSAMEVPRAKTSPLHSFGLPFIRTPGVH